MSRRRGRPERGGRRADPEDVLSGRVEPRLEDLFALIHEVNPTGEALSGAEAERRYQLKSRLQSLLIRRFGDEHLVVAPTAEHGIVSLEHHSGTRDACHAVLAELDPDARSWVTRGLDLGALGPEPEVPGGARSGAEPPLEAPRTPAELVASARRAIRGYDYEVAERWLREAMASDDGPDAALALLELLVEHLGIDDQALALEGHLRPGAAEHPAVQALLALAAARSGDVEHAQRLLKGLESPRAGAVHGVLADHALRAGEPERARRHLAALEEHDPASPDLVELRRRTVELEAESRRPVEDAIRRRADEEGALAVEAEARALSERWPGSEVIGGILRRAAELRREEALAR